MGDETVGQNPFLTQLAAIAWGLALVAAVSLGRLVIFATEDAAIASAHLVWLAVCVLSGCFSVGGFLLVAIKRAETRSPNP